MSCAPAVTEIGLRREAVSGGLLGVQGLERRGPGGRPALVWRSPGVVSKWYICPLK